MCTHTTSACVFPFYLPIETDELQPAQMISYLPVTFYLCASSYSKSHGTQIKKNEIQETRVSQKFAEDANRGTFWSLRFITHKVPSPSQVFFLLLLCTQKTQHVPLVQTWQQKRNQKQFFFSIFFKQIPIGQCACITHKHTPQISNHIILDYIIHLAIAYPR